MKKYILPLLAAWALQSCDPSMLDWDDKGNTCTINEVQWSCSRTDATTLYIKALLLNNNFDCKWNEEIPVGVTVYNNQWGVVSYKFESPNNPALEDERPNQTVLLRPDQALTWWIETANQWAPATVEIWTVTLDGKKQIIDTYTTNCEYTPPCEAACTATCFEITPNNHCQGTSIYSFDLCNKPTTVSWTVSLHGGMEFWRLPNGEFAPITIYKKNGSQIVWTPLSIVVVTEAWIWNVWHFTLTLNPGEKLYIQAWTKKAINSWNVKLTLNSWGIYQEIVTPFNDNNCNN